MGKKRIRNASAETVRGEGAPAFREEIVMVRMSAEEKALLRHVAGPAGMSEYIRSKLGFGRGLR